MIKLNSIYKCNICGNIVQVIHSGEEALVCCNQPMQKLVEQTTETGSEKHLPVIEKTEAGYEVKIGGIPHPMEEKHYIEWIELLADGKAYRQFLEASGAPEAIFNVDADSVSARELCNVHGLWKG